MCYVVVFWKIIRQTRGGPRTMGHQVDFAMPSSRGEGGAGACTKRSPDWYKGRAIRTIAMS